MRRLSVGRRLPLALFAAALVGIGALRHQHQETPALAPESPTTAPLLPVRITEAGAGSKVDAWYLAREKPRGYLLYLDGYSPANAQRATSCAHLNQQLGFAVVAVACSDPSAPTMVDDAKAAQRWFAEKMQIAPAEIILLGVSFGAEVASYLAADLGAKALILEDACFTHAIGGESAAPRSQFRGPLFDVSQAGSEEVPVYKVRKLAAISHPPQFEMIVPGQATPGASADLYFRALDDFLQQNGI
jgi:pimeloyl-ACP methyl ester carboxylesterase